MEEHHSHFLTKLLIEEQFDEPIPYDVLNQLPPWIFLNTDSLTADQRHQALYVW